MTDRQQKRKWSWQEDCFYQHQNHRSKGSWMKDRSCSSALKTIPLWIHTHTHPPKLSFPFSFFSLINMKKKTQIAHFFSFSFLSFFVTNRVCPVLCFAVSNDDDQETSVLNLNDVLLFSFLSKKYKSKRNVYIDRYQKRKVGREHQWWASMQWNEMYEYICFAERDKLKKTANSPDAQQRYSLLVFPSRIGGFCVLSKLKE